MELMKFSRLSLLSNKERRGLQIDLSNPVTVLVAGNGFGKSAILKSLYDALGAKPHKIDQTWRDAKVTALLEFMVGGTPYAALKSGDRYTILDGARTVLISTTHVVSELGPFFANLLSFSLVLADKKEQVKIPPPSYIFSPYYVDQDASWQKPWNSFTDLAMFPKASKPLSEYHSGLRPNSFYEAKAQRDLLKADLAKIELERSAITQALAKITVSMPTTLVAIDLDVFREETERLVAEGQSLHNAQAKYRNKLGALNEEFHLWSEQVAVIEAALIEIDASFKDALEEAPHVECPMCGQHYSNHIADQFELVTDKDELLQTLQTSREKMKDLSSKLAAQRHKIDEVESSIDRINRLLAVNRQDVSLRDLITAQGRREAHRVLMERMTELDAGAGEKQRLIADAEQRMKDAERPKRKQDIKYYFNEKLKEFATDLDFDLPEKMRDPIQGLQIGRGSVGPRALAAYYYAFLYTVRKHGTSAFCPIVIDAPNQQGQDKGHLEQIMTFLLQKRPQDTQVILGTEALTDSRDGHRVDISNEKKRVLREDVYGSILEYMSPFLTQSIL